MEGKNIGDFKGILSRPLGVHELAEVAAVFNDNT